MSENMKEVYFEHYCSICKNVKVKEAEDPCCECLGEGARPESHKPVNYEKQVNK